MKREIRENCNKDRGGTAVRVLKKYLNIHQQGKMYLFILEIYV